MLDLHDPKQAYEIFRLQWMIAHGYGIPDLIKNLEAMIEEDQNESAVSTSLQSLFQDWEFGIGFDGSIWPCYEEFLEHDYPCQRKGSDRRRAQSTLHRYPPHRYRAERHETGTKNS